MGTNFYMLKGEKSEGRHIGKRSAAGDYCWDCGRTLCADGNESIHLDASKDNWAKECPNCGKKRKNESLEKSSAGRELGFNKGAPVKKTGVASCSSFNWGTDPGFVLSNPPKKIIDEYGGIFTWPEFVEILEECPVWFTQSVGRDFS